MNHHHILLVEPIERIINRQGFFFMTSQSYESIRDCHPFYKAREFAEMLIFEGLTLTKTINNNYLITKKIKK